MRMVACVMVLAACGDNSSGPVPVVEGGCRAVPLTSLADQFRQSSDLGPIIGDTLDSFDPSGRWFFTGAHLGRSSVVLRSDEAGGFLANDFPLTRTDTELFGTFLQPRVGDTGTTGYEWRYAQRFSNLRDDGTMRYDYAYCETGQESCTVCTAGMVRAARNDPQPSEKLTLLGEIESKDWSGLTLDVKVDGTTAFVIRDTGLHAVDVTDPANPKLLGTYANTDRDTRSNDVELLASGGRRYAIIADSPVEIVEVTDPSHLVFVGVLPVEAHTLVIETRAGVTRAYFGSYDGTCPVFDVTDPMHAVRVGAFDAHASYVHDLSVHDGIGYLNAWEKGFFVVDFTDPAQPKQLGHWDAPLGASHANWTTIVDGRRIAVHGEETYGAHMTVIDVDPASPRFMQPLGEWETREYVSIHNFTGTGTKAYATYYQDGVRVIDLANPAQPVQLGYFNTWDPDDDASATGFYSGAIGLDLDLARKLVFVADTERGLLILRDDT